MSETTVYEFRRGEWVHVVTSICAPGSFGISVRSRDTARAAVLPAPAPEENVISGDPFFAAGVADSVNNLTVVEHDHYARERVRKAAELEEAVRTYSEADEEDPPSRKRRHSGDSDDGEPERKRCRFLDDEAVEDNDGDADDENGEGDSDGSSDYELDEFYVEPHDSDEDDDDGYHSDLNSLITYESDDTKSVIVISDDEDDVIVISDDE